MNEKVVSRFWKKIKKSDGCWTWTRDRHAGNRYGRIWTGERRVPAHRFSWELHYGQIPRGMEVCHRCDFTFCVRPDHLFLGTHAENMGDCAAKKRIVSGHVRGSRHGNAKLTESDVIDIRTCASFGASRAALRAAFGVGHSVISEILTRKAWTHVP